MKKDECRAVKPLMVLTISVCVILIFFAVVQIIRFFTEPGGEDPYWFDTYAEATSIEQATQLFGKDLLLEKMILPEMELEKTSYVLGFSEGGSVEDNTTWTMLTANVQYSNKDWASMTIFFDKNHESINGSDEYVGYNSVFEGDSTDVITINGVTVGIYTETSSNGYTYLARFERNDCTYFLTSFSIESADLGRNTIENLLDQ